jgi:ketosteroid isomerase-like protein
MGSDHTGRVGSERELVERAFALLDSDTYEQVLPLVHDDFEMVTTAEVASEPGAYRGPEGVRRWWTSFLDVMDRVYLEARSFEELDDGRVIVEFVIHARGSHSGIEAGQPAVAIATAADEKLRRLEFFTSIEQARAAGGSPPG